VSGVLLDVDKLSGADWDAVGPSLEAGLWVGLGALPTDGALGPDQLARKVLLRLLDLNLEPEMLAAQTVITPACGLASTTRDGALRALRTLRTAADIVTEQLAA
jgi:hypothetical protein